jgi:polyisoprenoid-binding protein YceI
MMTSHKWMLSALTAVPMLALAASDDVDSAKSTIDATFNQEGVAVSNPFKKFSGHIVYDAKDLAASSAVIEVETASFDMGSPEYNSEVCKKSWFDCANFPKAVFKSSSIKSDGANKFTATGSLTMKGKSVSLSVPVTVRVISGSNVYDGTVDISRVAFGIGDPVWNDVLDDKVSIRFHLTNAK